MNLSQWKSRQQKTVEVDAEHLLVQTRQMGRKSLMAAVICSLLFSTTTSTWTLHSDPSLPRASGDVAVGYYNDSIYLMYVLFLCFSAGRKYDNFLQWTEEAILSNN